MKKILFILSFILLGVSSGYSQLNVIHENREASELVAKLAKISFLELRWHSTVGYYILTKSDNQFDELVSIFLGKDGPSSIESLEYLITIAEDKVKSATISQGYREISILSGNPMKNHIFIRQRGNAGSSWISKKELQKAIKAIKEREKITD